MYPSGHYYELVKCFNTSISVYLDLENERVHLLDLNLKHSALLLQQINFHFVVCLDAMLGITHLPSMDVYIYDHMGNMYQLSENGLRVLRLEKAIAYYPFYSISAKRKRASMKPTEHKRRKYLRQLDDY